MKVNSKKLLPVCFHLRSLREMINVYQLTTQLTHAVASLYLQRQRLYRPAVSGYLLNTSDTTHLTLPHKQMSCGVKNGDPGGQMIGPQRPNRSVTECITNSSVAISQCYSLLKIVGFCLGRATRQNVWRGGASFSFFKKNYRLLWNSKLHYQVQKNPWKIHR